MAENRKGRGDSLYYLSRRQLFILAVGFILTSVLVFLLGILIGQGIEERKIMRKEEPMVRVPLRPLTPGSQPAQEAPAKEEMTFYDTLAKTPSGAEKTAKPAVKETKETKEAKGAKAVGPEETQAKEQKAKEKAPAEKTAAAGAKKAAPQKKPAEEDKMKDETAPSEGGWAVQVNAFPDEKAATRLVERLREKGYDAYVAVVNIKGQTWHRVRVGHLATREEAKELQEDLQNNEKFIKANIVSR